MSGFGAVLQGLGSGLISSGNWMAKGIEEENKMAREDQLLKMREELERDRIKWKMDEENTARKKQGTELMSAAQEKADERGNGLINSAMSAYDSLSATDPEGAALGKQAVEDAKAAGGYKQTVTADDVAQGGLEAGLISGKEYMAHEAQKEKDSREDRKLDITERANAIKELAAAARIELDSKKLDAMIKGMGAWARSSGGGSEASYVQTWKLMESKFPNASNDELMKYTNEALHGSKTSYTETTKDDPLTGKPTKETKVTRQGEPPAVNPRISNLPDGAKMIGTSGGKKVYQLPNGKRVIED